MTARDCTELRQKLLPRHDAMIDAWKAGLAPTGYVGLSGDEVRHTLASLIDCVLAALSSEPFEPAQAQRVGVELVKIGYTRPQAVSRTVEVFARELTAVLPQADAEPVRTRVAAVLAEIAAGFAYQMSERILSEQETIREA